MFCEVIILAVDDVPLQELFERQRSDIDYLLGRIIVGKQTDIVKQRAVAFARCRTDRRRPSSQPEDAR